MTADGYALRPMTAHDAPMVLCWRNSEHVRAWMYTDHPIAEEEHAAWTERMLHDDAHTVLIFEDHGRPLGLMHLHHVEPHASWGFYIGERDAPRGSGTRMAFLALDYTFLQLGVRALHCEAFAFNARAVALYARLGFSREPGQPTHRLKHGEPMKVIGFGLLRDEWFRHRETLDIFR